ncbi:MAG: sodium:solute symporter family protein [Psychrobacter alimentarius]
MYSSSESLILGSLVVIYFLFLFGVSFYINRTSIKTYDDYNVAGRSVSIFPLILTFVGTAVGGATLLGFMQNGFLYGMGQQWLNLAILISGLLMLGILLKKIRALGEKYQMVTIADFTVLRFGEGARIPTVVSVLVANCALTGMQFAAIATVLNLTMGLNITTGILISWVLLTLKTYYGGMKSVIWQDAFHGTIQTVGIFVLFVVAIIASGGLGRVSEQAALANQSEFLSLLGISPSEVFVYLLTIGAYQFVRQDLWQRFWAAGSAKIARNGYWVSIILTFITGVFIVSTGVMGRFGLNIGEIDSSLTYYTIIGNVFSFPMVIVMVIALLATVISSADSFCMSGASSIINDIIKPRLKETPDLDSRLLKYSRLSVVIVSVFSLILALSIPKLVGLWVTGAAMLVAGLLAPVIAGLFWKKATRLGGTVAMWVGLIVAVTWQILGHPFGLHPIFVGFPISILMIIVVSLVTTDESYNI